MKKISLVFFILCILGFKAQDKLFDSSLVRKNFFRIGITDVFLTKISVGWEHLLSKDYSFEADAFYKFPVQSSGDWISTLVYNNTGGEIRAGLSRHFNYNSSRLSLGVSLAYRQQRISGSVFSVAYAPDKKGGYALNQGKKGAGLLFKLNFRPNPLQSGCELFIMGGLYAAFTKSHYESFNPYSGYFITDPDKIPKITNNYLKDGFALLPYFSAGVAYAIKQPQKGWYSALKRERDSLRFRKRNILLYNPVELLDGSMGFTYMRVINRHALSAYTSVAFGGSDNSAALSNRLLLENSYSYYLSRKNADVLLGLNYNFTKEQQSFPFIGFSARVAQFDGSYRSHDFILNKYYAGLNVGCVLRSDAGLTFMLNLSPGHYFNDYVSNNPKPYMIADYFSGRYAGQDLLNSFNFSMQLGWSF